MTQSPCQAAGTTKCAPDGADPGAHGVVWRTQERVCRGPRPSAWGRIVVPGPVCKHPEDCGFKGSTGLTLGALSPFRLMLPPVTQE